MKRLLAPLVLGASLSALALVTLAAIALAASGVLVTRAGAWTTRVSVAPHLALDVNVAGLLRLATSPPGLRVLDGRSRDTALGRLHFQRADRALIVRCAPCAVNDRRLHTQPLTLDAVELRLTQRDAATVDGRIISGSVQVPFTAGLRTDGIEVEWSLAPTEIAALYRVLDHAIPEAALASIGGRLQARGTLKLPSAVASTRVAIDGFAVGGLGTERLQHGAFEFACHGDGVPRTQLTGEGQRAWLPADRLGADLPAAVLAAEDQRFDSHAGFDAEEIGHALVRTTADGPARGASTITQQLARMLFTGADRTGVRKLRELLYAVEMERTLGKARILELYLNTIDWGPGICGARAAARSYFDKTPSRLTALEAAWLASILRQPHAAYERQFLARAPRVERAQQVLAQMRGVSRRNRAKAAQSPLVFAPAPAAVVHARVAAR